MQITWKDIPTIPNANEFLDVVLNRTQRKTPTVIRAGFKISRIRAFYMRKVRYTADGFSEKLQAIVDSFPNINDIHPFHRDLLDTLYEKNHYKVSLASVSRAKNLVEQVSRDYVRLLKFGQSLFQCKQLKRAAMGRMATIVKRLKDALLYLEQVRQHLGRLPAIDPNTRTLLICGYPNVGKSSFLRTVTRAEVDVQPYAFTTKSLYVGHFDYKYLRFQAIDTPGILDRPTEEMNNIEMQSIYAIAHIRSCVLYFMDLSEQCGFSVEDQVKLFHSIKPLFANKQVFVVVNKIDVTRPEDLSPEKQDLLKSMMTGVEGGSTEILQISCATEEGVMAVRNKACEALLTARIEHKLKSSARVNALLNRIHVSRPAPRDDVERSAYVPEGAMELRDKFDINDPNRKMLSRDLEEMGGGAGVFQPDYKDAYMLEDEQWKHDIIPELLNGKNVYDFIDPEISAKLQALEDEEEKLEQEGFYDDNQMEEDDEETAELLAKAAWIREKHAMMKNASRSKRTIKNKGIIPRSKLKKTLGAMESHFADIGMDVSALTQGAKNSAAASSAAQDMNVSGADVVLADQDTVDASRLRGRDQTDRKYGGVGSAKRTKAERLAKLDQRGRNRMARAGEGDRHTTASLPKHLFSGKRGIGKTQRR